MKAVAETEASAMLCKNWRRSGRDDFILDFIEAVVVIAQAEVNRTRDECAALKDYALR